MGSILEMIHPCKVSAVPRVGREMAGTRRNPCQSARRSLFIGFVLFAAAQLALAVVLEHHFPELRDPEFGYKLKYLRQKIEAEPGRPLLLAVGSSLVFQGLGPACMPASNPEQADAPLFFNFGLPGGGPLLELLCLRRLLAAGVRPRWLILEVMPPLLAHAGFWPAEESHHLTRLTWNDLRFLEGYGSPSWNFYGTWLHSRLVPCHEQRLLILNAISPHWLPDGSYLRNLLRGLQPCGWLPFGIVTVDAETRRRALAAARAEYPPPLFADFKITCEADRALREILTICRREQICLLLLVMPESQVFQSWYGPCAQRCLGDYLSTLQRDFRTPVVDARNWVAEEGFVDGHHLAYGGAVIFSERLGREVLRPLLEERAQVPLASCPP